jgi:uncharacterized repeat protein (TIGR03803 family)
MKLRICGLLAIAAIAVAPGLSHAATPTLTTLVSFDGTDISGPTGLVVDADGNLFGTAEGGAYGYGVVFEIAKTASGYASTPIILVSFNGTNGEDPNAGLIADAIGNLFGTTYFGGACPLGDGTVFEIAKTNSGYARAPTTLVSFGCTLSEAPSSGLIADANGNLFGATIRTSASSVFEVAKTGGGYASTITRLTMFNGVGVAGRLTIDANGNLFGATSQIRPEPFHGTVFEIAKTASGYASTPTTLYSFCAQVGCIDGAVPNAGLIADANGNLFGTTSEGGAYGGGTVFKIAKTADGYASTPTTLVSFNLTDGASPAGLIADAIGNLFGTTSEGGAYGGGTVFKIAKTADGYASTPTFLVNFCAMPECTDGERPTAGLVADAEGNLFGTTVSGGAHGYGTVFEITNSGFVPPGIFAGTPGNANCFAKSLSAVARKYGDLDAAAAALGYSSVPVLQNDLAVYCAG